MKFSQNGLYIERYLKCANCGVLIYEGTEDDDTKRVEPDGRLFCSAWCVDWAHEREARRAGQQQSKPVEA
ncbi:hypothetical protein [Bordetella trematum]|uniref:hypothetical protein n=1 Tax=Bordetella trematum TaxID=123899 RepID=UPI0039895A5E